jgi:medium-chain acyl-[acyl-carrier-protein] hydrolase
MARAGQGDTGLDSNPVPHVRLLCFPYAGGNSSIFLNWASYLPRTIEVSPVELPGRQHRFKEAAVTQLSRLVPALVRELEPLLDLPYALFGHSVGALIAFEIARELRRTNTRPPVHLFVSAHPAPQLQRRQSFIHLLPDHLFLNQVYHLFPPEVAQNRELMALVMQTMRADLALGETYHYIPEPPLDCPISAIGGNLDFGVTRHELAAWQFQTNKRFNMYLFPGDHFYLSKTPQSLLQMVEKELG